ncbi:AAA family ATPase [Turicibacter sanguinis]|uniref:AAA family ATPase n=1 Tax=Turicibacter sanguinis TaxID=154288 RepID=UPI0021D4C661|nr:ATP-binding protein [Turicibacter sanguinis]MCU7195927.1 ATP-binding protein [Turicibacter sanguinis]
MQLQFKNIGKISAASIDIDGITVIAGENNTGKSTVGKALFCIFNTFYNIEERILNERRERMYFILRFAFKSLGGYILEWDLLVDDILMNKEVYLENKKEIAQAIIEFTLEYSPLSSVSFDKIELDAVEEQIIEILEISDNEILKTILGKKFNTEFNGQINNIFVEESLAQIKLKIKDFTLEALVENDDVIEIINDLSLQNEVVYLDDPFSLDNVNNVQFSSNIFRITVNESSSHREHLERKLATVGRGSDVENAMTEILVKNKLATILEKIDVVCGGEIVQDKRQKMMYKPRNSDKTVNVKSLSTGLKTFVILKILLQNGSIRENGTLILDEPEIHLHPQWQIVFAELIVLLQKEFNLHILLNTHSPYFLEAIEVYSKKHNVPEKCKYYLAENTGDGQAEILDVTDNTELIYKKLAEPFQTLEDVEYIND